MRSVITIPAHWREETGTEIGDSQCYSAGAADNRLLIVRIHTGHYTAGIVDADEWASGRAVLRETVHVGTDWRSCVREVTLCRMREGMGLTRLEIDQLAADDAASGHPCPDLQSHLAAMVAIDD